MKVFTVFTARLLSAVAASLDTPLENILFPIRLGATPIILSIIKKSCSPIFLRDLLNLNRPARRVLIQQVTYKKSSCRVDEKSGFPPSSSPLLVVQMVLGHARGQPRFRYTARILLPCCTLPSRMRWVTYASSPPTGFRVNALRLPAHPRACPPRARARAHRARENGTGFRLLRRAWNEAEWGTRRHACWDTRGFRVTVT